MSATDGFAPRVIPRVALLGNRLLRGAGAYGHSVLLGLWAASAGQNVLLRDRAIRVLEGGSADSDLRDWAERMLCGMTDKAPEEFMEDRRAQS